MIKKLLLCCFYLLINIVYSQNPFSVPAHLKAIRSGAIADLAPFFHGVASGDPLHNSLIIWTRLTTDSITAQVSWRIATDTGMLQIIDSGLYSTNASKDFSVKVDVQNLQANHYYYYEFEYQGKRSLRGRRRTLPIGDVDSIRFASVSCANYENGFFNVYNALANRNDIDYVLHLGDYIYEYQTGLVSNLRIVEPLNEIINLYDYRARYSYYKLDYDLILLHQQYPFICIWDDHETANDSWAGGAQNHTDGAEGLWANRKSYATRAYQEWLPIRRPDPIDSQRIYRMFRIGDLVQLSMLDTRLQGRNQQNGIDLSINRTILGNQQFDWFCNNMDTSTALWQLVGQQVSMTKMFRPISISPPTGALYRADGWDGYSAERNRLFDTIIQKQINNFVVLTGDLHSGWASNLPTVNYNPNTRQGSAGVEFICNSITSPNHTIPASINDMLFINPHISYIELTGHGYVVLDVNKQRSQAHFYNVGRIDSLNYVDNLTAMYFVNNGERHLNIANQQATANPAHYPSPAPLSIRGNYVNIERNPYVNLDNALINLYPNPFYNQITIQYSLKTTANVSLQIANLAGQRLFFTNIGQRGIGLNSETINIDNLAAGTYLVTIMLGDKIHTRQIVKVR